LIEILVNIYHLLGNITVIAFLFVFTDSYQLLSCDILDIFIFM